MTTSTATDAMAMTMRFGAQLWSQQTSFADFRDAARAAEEAGWDSVWTWDHLMAIFGPWEQPILEGWLTLAGVGAVTSRVRLGLMVGANTFRNPGLTAKLAATLDNITEGRAVLGIGGAWFEREHEAYGIPEWGSGIGERLDRLDESVMLMRRLLDGERFCHEGRFYTMTDALANPRPIQPHLPILIGGSGPRKTLRTVALRGDAWNTSGTVDEVIAKLAILDEHCTAVGRDRSTIELTISFPIIIRDDAPAAREAYASTLANNGTEDMGNVPTLLGPPSLVADGIRPFRDLGFRTVIVRLAAPHDRQTIERMPEVDALLADA
jgi:alkanesulfonate monooxygenase SsuD/methylene tetrahydromethanopterin reductase-like flavin-dependent oxidoreductase (luciferase family)